ncbi:MAG: PIN domain-containing protein [Candidatus Hadarchaeota archaeon]
MGLFAIDSVVLAAAALKRDARHRDASKILATMGVGKLGRCVFTDYVMAETLTLIRFSGRGGVEASNKVYEAMLSSPHLELVRVNDIELKIAGEIFKKYPNLSFVDSTTVALMQSRGIKDLISFDRGFDWVPSIVRREEI